jgi:hypothetical protein
LVFQQMCPSMPVYKCIIKSKFLHYTCTVRILCILNVQSCYLLGTGKFMCVTVQYCVYIKINLCVACLWRSNYCSLTSQYWTSVTSSYRYSLSWSVCPVRVHVPIGWNR